MEPLSAIGAQWLNLAPIPFLGSGHGDTPCTPVTVNFATYEIIIVVSILQT